MVKKNNDNITVVILTANEQDVIELSVRSACLLTKNILVIDSHSSDRTVQIAKRNGAKVIAHQMTDFASQRNFALKQVKTDWVFYLDADEELNEKVIEEIDGITSIDVPFGGYYVKRDTYYFGKRWGFEDQVQRLFRTKKLKEWVGVVHETPHIEDSFGTLLNPIKHNTHRNLSQMLRKTNEWSEYEARLRLDSKHPKMNPLRFFRVMLTAFWDSYVHQKGYRNGTFGIIESMYQAFSMFVTYAKLWELQERKNMKENMKMKQ